MPIEIAAHGGGQRRKDDKSEKRRRRRVCRVEGGILGSRLLVKKHTNKKGLHLDSRQKSVVVQISLLRSAIFYIRCEI